MKPNACIWRMARFNCIISLNVHARIVKKILFISWICAHILCPLTQAQPGIYCAEAIAHRHLSDLNITIKTHHAIRIHYYMFRNRFHNFQPISKLVNNNIRARAGKCVAFNLLAVRPTHSILSTSAPRQPIRFGAYLQVNEHAI